MPRPVAKASPRATTSVPKRWLQHSPIQRRPSAKAPLSTSFSSALREIVALSQLASTLVRDRIVRVEPLTLSRPSSTSSSLRASFHSRSRLWVAMVEDSTVKRTRRLPVASANWTKELRSKPRFRSCSTSESHRLRTCPLFANSMTTISTRSSPAERNQPH